MSIGIIAGTGVDLPIESWSEVATPYGPACLSTARIGEHEVVLLRRHGPGLNVPPHLINHHANLSALCEAGVRRVIATAAVGSLRRELSPGSLAVVCDFIDFTRHRVGTIFDRPAETVVHTDFSTPYCREISSALERAAEEIKVDLTRRVTYVCVDGPRYETPAEVRMFAHWGGDVVGMTGAPEVVIAREMGLCYGALAILSNYAAGIVDEPLSHEYVVRCVSERRQQIHDVLAGAVALIPEARTCCG
jgi:5'-methylthioadenosine phosphorylase